MISMDMGGLIVEKMMPEGVSYICPSTTFSISAVHAHVTRRDIKICHTNQESRNLRYETRQRLYPRAGATD